MQVAEAIRHSVSQQMGCAVQDSLCCSRYCPLHAQGMMIAEMYMDHLARAMGKPLAELQALNFYSEGQATHFGQPLIGCQARGLRMRQSWCNDA